MNRFEAVDNVKQTMIDRGATYGDLRKNWEKGAKRMSRLFKKNITLEQYGVSMIAVKLARLQNKDCRHVDSLNDIIGYAALTLEIITNEH